MAANESKKNVASKPDFISWNIKIITNQLLNQAAKKCLPSHFDLVAIKVRDKINSEHNYFCSLVDVETIEEIKQQAINGRIIFIDLYKDYIEEINHALMLYEPFTFADERFRYLSVVYYFDKLLESLKDTAQLISTSKLHLKEKSKQRSFTELLIGGYSKEDLDSLLIHLLMIEKDGKRIWPQAKKSALFGVIAALNHKKHLKEATLKELMSGLSTYLNLKDSRVKDGYSVIQKEIERQALSFLNQPVKPKQ